MSIGELRARLLALRADRLLAASLAGTLDGLRDVIGVEGPSTILAKPGLAFTKALGDSTGDVVYTPVTPCRLVETRGTFAAVYQGNGSAAHTPVPFAPNQIRSYTVQGGNGVCQTQLPAGLNASAVQLQVFGLPTTPASGDLEILPQGASFGSTATMVYVGAIAFNTVSTNARINLPNHQISVQVRGGGAHLAIDVVGYFAAPTGSGGKFFQQGGNAFGTTALLGTIDNQPLNVQANGQRVMRYEPNATSPNVVGGHPNNSVYVGSLGQTIGGGGNAAHDCLEPSTGQSTRSCANVAGLSYSTVGGGTGNMADIDPLGNGGSHATVGGGGMNTASGNGSTIAGGLWNIASQVGATVGGGESNSASELDATVAGGGSNTAANNGAAIGGGSANTADGAYSTIAAFGLGDDDKTIVGTNLHGVALAAIQGLHRGLQKQDARLRASLIEKDAQIRGQQREIAALQQHIADLEGMRSEMAAMQATLAQLRRERGFVATRSVPPAAH